MALAVILIAYFIPTLIAACRQHRNVGPIVILNLFLGWTLVGWVAALCWAATSQPAPVVVTQTADSRWRIDQ